MWRPCSNVSLVGNFGCCAQHRSLGLGPQRGQAAAQPQHAGKKHSYSGQSVAGGKGTPAVAAAAAGPGSNKGKPDGAAGGLQGGKKGGRGAAMAARGATLPLLDFSLF